MTRGRRARRPRRLGVGAGAALGLRVGAATLTLLGVGLWWLARRPAAAPVEAIPVEPTPAETQHVAAPRDATEGASGRRARTPGRAVVAGLVLAGVLALPVTAVAWRLSGGSFYIVRTASMGTTAPVGSLVLDRSPGTLHPGQIITFRPSGTPLLFTHRIVALMPGGRIITRGDANSAPDPWTITRRQIAGRVMRTIPYLGWLIRAVPLLAFAVALVLALVRITQPPWRPTLVASGLVAAITLAVGILHPLIGSSILTFSADGHAANAAVISTGVLPIRVTAVGGGSEAATDGQTVRVSTRRIGPGHRYRLRIEPDWQWWWLLPLAMLALVPGAVSLRPASRAQH